MHETDNIRLKEFLEKVGNVERAMPSPLLFKRIEQQLQHTSSLVPLQKLKWVAAAALLIAFTNVWVIAESVKQKTETETELSVYAETTLFSIYNP